MLHLWPGSKVPNTHTSSSQPHRGPLTLQPDGGPGKRDPGSPWPGSESPEATTMKSRRLFRAACSLGTILLSHKCFKFLSFCLQGFWQPQAEGECSGTDTDSPWRGKVRPGQPEKPAGQSLFPEASRDGNGTHSSPLPCPTLSQGSCQIPAYMTSSGDQSLVCVDTKPVPCFRPGCL